MLKEQHLLKQKLSTVANLKEEDWLMMQSKLEPIAFLKNEVLLKEGAYCKGTYFITKGAFRTYHLKSGTEVHTAFYFENDFIRDIESLSLGVPSKVNIVALENAMVYHISKDAMIKLYDQSPSFQYIGRKLLELMTIAERRYTSLFTDFQPKERYEYVLANYPELVQRVPLQYLASFLGVARETLSRIRKRL